LSRLGDCGLVASVTDLDEFLRLEIQHFFEIYKAIEPGKSVVVGDDVLKIGKIVVVATGSGAAMPPIPGLDTVKAWTPASTPGA